MQECVKAAAGGARVHGGFDETAELWRNSIAGLALTILLYFGGEPDVVRIVHPGERPAVKSKLERRDPQRFRDLREPTHYAVVKEVSRAMSDGKSSTAETPAWRQGEQCGRTCATRIPTCTGPDQAARNRACASSFQSPSRAARDRRGAIRH